jgi:hypothetical protein
MDERKQKGDTPSRKTGRSRRFPIGGRSICCPSKKTVSVSNWNNGLTPAGKKNDYERQGNSPVLEQER